MGAEQMQLLLHKRTGRLRLKSSDPTPCKHKCPIQNTAVNYSCIPNIQENRVQARAYRLKKRACNFTPIKIQTEAKNSNGVYS